MLHTFLIYSFISQSTENLVGSCYGDLVNRDCIFLSKSATTLALKCEYLLVLVVFFMIMREYL